MSNFNQSRLHAAAYLVLLKSKMFQNHLKVVTQGEFGSDVEEKKPIVYVIGKDEVKSRQALQRSQDLFGNNDHLIYNY